MIRTWMSWTGQAVISDKYSGHELNWEKQPYPKLNAAKTVKIQEISLFREMLRLYGEFEETGWRKRMRAPRYVTYIETVVSLMDLGNWIRRKLPTFTKYTVNFPTRIRFDGWIERNGHLHWCVALITTNHYGIPGGRVLNAYRMSCFEPRPRTDQNFKNGSDCSFAKH